jgi:hypothetical protein
LTTPTARPDRAELRFRDARIPRLDDQRVHLIGYRHRQVGVRLIGERGTQRRAVDDPVDVDDHRPAEAGHAPLGQPEADRHAQPDPVPLVGVVAAQAGGQGPDQHGEHHGRVDIGRQHRVNAVACPLMVEILLAEH